MWGSKKEPFKVRSALPCPGCGGGVSNHDQRFIIRSGEFKGRYAHGYDRDAEGRLRDLVTCTDVELCPCHDCKVLHGLRCDHSVALAKKARAQQKRSRKKQRRQEAAAAADDRNWYCRGRGPVGGVLRVEFVE